MRSLELGGGWTAWLIREAPPLPVSSAIGSDRAPPACDPRQSRDRAEQSRDRKGAGKEQSRHREGAESDTGERPVSDTRRARPVSPPTGVPSEVWLSEESWKPVLAALVRGGESFDGGEILKAGARSLVLKAELSTPAGRVPFVAKRFLPDTGWRRLAAVFRPSRARRSFERGWDLLRLGLRTPTPIAVIESRRGGGSWLITGFVDGLTDLDDIALRRLSALPLSEQHRIKRRLSERVVEFLVRLRLAGYAHRDFKAANVMIRNWADDPSVWMLDLEGLRRIGSPERGMRGDRLEDQKARGFTIPTLPERELVRLASSLLSYRSITRSDCMRFLRLCLRRSPRSEQREAFRRMERSLRLRHRRAVARKRGRLDGHLEPL
ncbi:MAG: hypothetical protein D6788_10665 [Planctomycetota bacterium]|nr:MAG: hypothetical protein D6788_10665 [Planctomycetota bacterium]